MNVAYTCSLGGYDELRGISDAIAGSMRFVAFTDRASCSGDGWEIRPLAGLDEVGQAPPRLIARWHKHHPHVLFPEADWSIWIDANLEVVGVLNELIESVSRADHSLGAFRHPWVVDYAHEAGTILSLDLEEPETIVLQIQRYSRSRMVDPAIHFETGCLVRRHRDERIRNFQSIWWHEIVNGSIRDQVSFAYSRWKGNVGCYPLEGYLHRSLPLSTHFIYHHHVG